MSEYYHRKSDIAHIARMLRRVVWCERYEHVLELIATDRELSEWCQHGGYWGKGSSSHSVLSSLVYGSFMHEAYECGMIPKSYTEDVETIVPWKEAGKLIMNPRPDFLAPLTSRQVLACIAYHFRADHFDNGSLLEESLPNGSLLQLVKAYREKALSEIDSYEEETISKALTRVFRKRVDKLK